MGKYSLGKRFILSKRLLEENRGCTFIKIKFRQKIKVKTKSETRAHFVWDKEQKESWLLRHSSSPFFYPINLLAKFME
jgi:ketosteroid isomerase-like protein